MKCIIRTSYRVHYLGRDWTNKDGVIELPDEIVRRKAHIFEPQDFVDSKIPKVKISIEEKVVDEKMVTNRAITESSTRKRMR